MALTPEALQQIQDLVHQEVVATQAAVVPVTPPRKTLHLPTLSPKVRDYLERVVWTFITSFSAGLSASTMFNLSTVRSAALAGGAAVFTLISIPVRNKLPVVGNVGTGLFGAKKATG